MDVEELCRLLRDAERRYSTLRCEFIVRFYPEIAAKAERQQIESGKVKLAGISAEDYFRGWDELAGKVTEYRALAWVRRPDCYREQDFDEDEPTLLVRDGTRWWRDRANQVLTGDTADDEQPLAAMGRYEMCVTPEPLISRIDFELLGAGERVGREVIRAKARRLPPRPPSVPVSPALVHIVGFQVNDYLPVFANGDDDFTVEIDAATGVILRIASVFESQDWMVIEAVEAVLDEPLPDDMFTIPHDKPAEGTVKGRRGLELPRFDGRCDLPPRKWTRHAGISRQRGSSRCPAVIRRRFVVR